MIQVYFFEMILYVPIILTIAMIIAMMLNQKIKLRNSLEQFTSLVVILGDQLLMNFLIKELGQYSVKI